MQVQKIGFAATNAKVPLFAAKRGENREINANVHLIEVKLPPTVPFSKNNCTFALKFRLHPLWSINRGIFAVTR
ncbi:hypothetical protein PA598K_03631 [Paenibacillus sp. 598K]|uniref:hypothetical protein n=1 Tax=Paenibacillus sp. 598K TaxID=1117987 RepID=UPI000FFAC06E|nr:hypothetical protein [Paenibacillus sp. 598K]GBF75241.1 hypothetical protein PA598K_03631 [Paenibacillus sp. 598K]